MDLKLVMQSNEVDTTGVCMKDGGDVYSLRRDRCVADVSQQLGHNVQNIAMASDVLTRLRTLDITSLISTDPTNCGYGDTLTRQPTQTLHLAASPSLRRLRLNWAKIRVHELRLNLASNHGAYDSVNSLALNGIVNLQEVLTRFPRVTDLSLWLGQHESPSPDIQLGDICEWMPQLHKMEVGDVPQDFALKPLTSMLRLNRLALHDTFACDVLMRVAGQMELNAISGIYLWNKMPNSFVLGFIHALNGPAAELSVYASYWPWRWKDPNYEFCAEDGHGRSRIFHSTHYNSEYSEEIAGYATVNTDMVALDGVLPEVMPQLTTLRVREPIGSFRTHDTKVTPLSCPALVHIELYAVHERKLDEEEGVLSGTDVLNWISHHLKDFAQPLNTLRVVGVRVGSDLGALDGLASNILFSPSSLVEYVLYLFRSLHSHCTKENVHGLILRWQLICLRS